MALNSYRMARVASHSNPQKEMMREKKLQVRMLYGLAADREDSALLNGAPFIESPRIFDEKAVDNVHYKITIETVQEGDSMECGDYLEYNGMVWLCLNSYLFHGLYCRATFMSCDWKIYWVKEDGSLASQYIIDQNSTQYNSGETNGAVTTIGSAQHVLKMQCNDDTVLLDAPTRLAIDKNLKNPTCYKITQNDNTSYNYGKGLCCITVTEVPLNRDIDKLITMPDGKQAWICDYKEGSRPPYDIGYKGIKASISGNTNLNIGYKRTYTLEPLNQDGKPWQDDTPFSWKVVSGFEVHKKTYGNKIELTVDNKDLLGSSFLLQAMVGSDIIAETKITLTRWF